MKEADLSLPNIGDVMSNFDHEVDAEQAARLREGDCIGQYPAWNFFGYVWFEDGEFHCMVKQYRVHVATLSASTLEELMEDASNRYGND